jgi:hypothetical protein
MKPDPQEYRCQFTVRILRQEDALHNFPEFKAGVSQPVGCCYCYRQFFILLFSFVLYLFSILGLILQHGKIMLNIVWTQRTVNEKVRHGKSIRKYFAQVDQKTWGSCGQDKIFWLRTLEFVSWPKNNSYFLKFMATIKS